MKNLSLHNARQLVLALAISSLFGCASVTMPAMPTTVPSAAISTVPLGQASESANYYLQQAQMNVGEQQLAYLLLAARAYLNSQQPLLAQQLLAQIHHQVPTTGTLAAEQRLLLAKLSLLQDNREQAREYIAWPSSWVLPNIQWQGAIALAIRIAELDGDPLARAVGHYELAQYLPTSQQQANWDALWLALTETPSSALPTFSADPQWGLWLELANLMRSEAANIEERRLQIAQWQQRHPAHPAARHLPTGLQQLLDAQPVKLHKVAIMLPLSGRFGQQAKAVQDGILANVMNQAEQPEVVFFDTDTLDVESAYQQARDQGMDFIIGPLLRENVDALLALYQGDIPLLTLNHSSAPMNHQNLFMFALTPEEEARQAALRMHQQGQINPLILAANNSISRRMAEQFQHQWQQLSDSAVEVHYFSNYQKIREELQHALQVDQSQARINRMKRIFGAKLEADFRSRRDVDSLYVIADSDQIRMVKPFVDVTLSVFSEPMAIYTSSRAHSKNASNERTQELEGIHISDMPWLLTDNALLQQAQKLWPKRDLAQHRLFAMGYDSWSLISQLAQMRAFDGQALEGISGQLHVDQQGLLQRTLSWGQYQPEGLMAE